jgi:DNA-binding NarL/FixJ family response regulator
LNPKVLVVDDHPMIIHAVEAMVQEIAPGVDVLQSRTLMQGIAFCEARPEICLVLLDLNLPDSRHTEGLALLHGKFPRLPIVVYTGQEHESVRSACLRQGATEFVLKSGNRAALYEVVERFLPSYVRKPASESVHVDNILSVRQRDVLRLLISGSTNREIGQALNIGEATVKTHVKVIYSRTNCRNRVELFQWHAQSKQALT